MVQTQEPLPAAETHTHHHMPSTGVSWLDKILPFSALAISVVSIAVAVHHGEIMNEMAKSNERAAAASVWPSLVSTGGMKPGSETLFLEVANTGIGPAQLESFQIFFQDKPMTDMPMLLKACCGGELAKTDTTKLSIFTGTVAPNVLGPKDSSTVFQSKITPETRLLWSKFIQQGGAGVIKLRACYCSVFDQCWETNFQTSRPKPVAECPANVVQFQGSDLAKANADRKAAKAQ